MIFPKDSKIWSFFPCELQAQSALCDGNANTKQYIVNESSQQSGKVQTKLKQSHGFACCQLQNKILKISMCDIQKLNAIEFGRYNVQLEVAGGKIFSFLR